MDVLGVTATTEQTADNIVTRHMQRGMPNLKKDKKKKGERERTSKPPTWVGRISLH